MKTTTKSKPKTAKKKAAKPLLVLMNRETCSIYVEQISPKRFYWSAQQSDTCFAEDEPLPGDLDEQGEAKTLQEAAQAAFDALADHLDIE